MGDFTNYVLGSGTVKINGVDAGYLNGAVKVRKGVEVKTAETGVPLRRIGSRVTKEIFEIEAPLAEFTAENIEAVLGITPVVTAASEVDKTTSFESLTFAEIVGQEGLEQIKLGPTAARSEWVTITAASVVITNSTEVTTYNENDDYIVNYDTGAVILNPGGAISSGETVKCKYKYTPTASTRFDFGTLTQVPTFTFEFVHEDPQTGAKFTAYMHKAEADPTAEWEFKGDDFVVTNLKIAAVDDANNNPTNPLGWIKNE